VIVVATTGNINFALDPAGFISGQVTVGGTPLANVQVNATDTTTNQFVEGVRSIADGTYTISLPAGSYLVRARPSESGLPCANEYYDGVFVQTLATPVSVAAGATTSGINFSLEPAQSQGW
jgi:hypothetical protein